MRVLVVNCGSTTVRVDAIEAEAGARLASARAERLGSDDAERLGPDGRRERLGRADHAAALARLVPEVAGAAGGVEAVGHRVVHGGERFTAPARVDAGLLAAIEALGPLAPLHNPVQARGIRVTGELLPGTPQVAVFDTAFFAELPLRAATYALPRELARRHGIRRYGFHGISHAFVARRAAVHLGRPLPELRLVTCHLGGGASLAAIAGGRAVETSMGMTPIEGLVMGTRSGDVDPGALVHLLGAEDFGAAGLSELLNRRSGLLALAGTADMRDLEARAAEGDEAARLALEVFCHRLRKYLGAYLAVLGGADAVVFTAGIGEGSALVRHRAVSGLGFLGLRLDEVRNRGAGVSAERPVAEISAGGARIRLLVVHTDEALAIAEEVADLLRQRGAVPAERTLPVAVSARHVHLSPEAVEVLFGPGHALTPERRLSQPGQFAARERVALVGPRGRIEGVRVVGPTRPRSQVEITRTDAFRLGVDAPLRLSGDLDGTPGLVLEGPAGSLQLEEGVICAARHIHMPPDDAARLGLRHRDRVEVALDTAGRDLVFGDVVVRVSEDYALELHLDTDEANAAGIRGDADAVLLETGCRGRVRRPRSRTAGGPPTARRRP